MSKSTARKEGPDDVAYAAAATDAFLVGVALSDGRVDVGGDEAARGGGLVRRQPRDRVSAVGPLPRGWVDGAARPPIDAWVPSSPPVSRRRAGDPGAAPADERWAAGDRRDLRSASFHGRQGAA